MNCCFDLMICFDLASYTLAGNFSFLYTDKFKYQSEAQK